MCYEYMYLLRPNQIKNSKFIITSQYITLKNDSENMIRINLNSYF